eukprot:112065_1
MGLANVDEKDDRILILNKNHTKSIEIYSCHISAQSDKFDGKSSFIGFILYSYNGETKWKLNGVSCRSGYIYLCKCEHLKNIQASPLNTMQAKCYKKLFGEDPDYTKIVAAGFGFTGQQWRYKSTTFNTPNKYALKLALAEWHNEWHDNNRRMHPKEEKLVSRTIKQWIDSNFTKTTLFVNPVLDELKVQKIQQQQYQNEIEILKKKKEQESIDIMKQYQQQIRTSNEDIENYKLENNALNNEVNELTEESCKKYQKYNNTIKKLTNNLIEKDNSIKKITNKNEEYKQELKAIQLELQKHKQESNGIIKKYEQQIEEINDLKVKLSYQLNEVITVKASEDTIKKEYESLKMLNMKQVDESRKLHTENQIHKIKMHNDMVNNDTMEHITRKYHNEIQQRKDLIIKTNEQTVQHISNEYELQIENLKKEHQIEILEIKSNINDEKMDAEESNKAENPLDKIISYFTVEFPLFAAVFSWYTYVVFITSMIFADDDECSIGDIVLSSITFGLFLLIPIIYELIEMHYKQKNEHNGNDNVS